MGLPGSSKGKECACNAGHLDLIPGWERSPGEGNDNPFWYSCLENPMDREAWWDIVHGVAKSQTLSLFHQFESLFHFHKKICQVCSCVVVSSNFLSINC